MKNSTTTLNGLLSGTTQEVKNVIRISNQRRAANLLYRFCQKGFKSYSGFKNICVFYDNSITVEQTKLFWQLSHQIDSELNDKVESIIEKLKDE